MKLVDISKARGFKHWKDWAKRNSVVKYDNALLSSMQRAMRVVNQRKVYVADLGDSLDPEGPTGDCEDYAVAYWQALVGMGVSVAAPRLTYCWTDQEKTNFHAVLTIDTTDGTWVLDQAQGEPLRIEAFSYIWVSRVSIENAPTLTTILKES